jgi:hypothetical protein
MGHRAFDWRPDPTHAHEPVGHRAVSVSMINARVCFVKDGLEPERIVQCALCWRFLLRPSGVVSVPQTPHFDNFWSITRDDVKEK